MGKTLSDAEVLRQVPEARRRAARLRQRVPHAETVRLDRGSRTIHLVLTNGTSLGIPIDLVPALRRASDRDLGQAVVGPGGVGVRWEGLGVDLTVESLARMALGATVLLRAAGAAGGAARTTAKARAARLNGLRGGRPRKKEVRPA